MRGDFTIVYATPEKLLTWQQGLRNLQRVAHIVCLAVDESHCVSEWGHDFRPDYRRLGELRDVLGFKIPLVGLTASATVAVQADIVRNLRLVQPLVAKASLNRPNLKYCVITRTGPNDLLRLIHEYRKEQLLARGHTGSSSLSAEEKASVPFYSTLIYVNSKKETEELAKLLVECRLLSGIKVAFYHAGMQPQDRSAVHLAFSKDEIQVVIATVAFGMGERTVRFLCLHCPEFTNLFMTNCRHQQARRAHGDPLRNDQVGGVVLPADGARGQGRAAGTVRASVLPPGRGALLQHLRLQSGRCLCYGAARQRVGHQQQ